MSFFDRMQAAKAKKRAFVWNFTRDNTDAPGESHAAGPAAAKKLLLLPPPLPPLLPQDDGGGGAAATTAKRPAAAPSAWSKQQAAAKAAAARVDTRDRSGRKQAPDTRTDRGRDEGDERDRFERTLAGGAAAAAAATADGRVNHVAGCVAPHPHWKCRDADGNVLRSISWHLNNAVAFEVSAAPTRKALEVFYDPPSWQEDGREYSFRQPREEYIWENAEEFGEYDFSYDDDDDREFDELDREEQAVLRAVADRWFADEHMTWKSEDEPELRVAKVRRAAHSLSQ